MIEAAEKRETLIKLGLDEVAEKLGKLKKLDLDSMTPLEALAYLAKLKENLP